MLHQKARHRGSHGGERRSVLGGKQERQTRKTWVRADSAVLVSVAGRSSTRGGGGREQQVGGALMGETGGRGARQPYLARSLLVGGGGGTSRGTLELAPSGSGGRASVGGVGGCTLGGVEEHLREEDEPLRETQEVSITLTPMLQWDRDAQPIKSRKGVCDVEGGRFRCPQPEHTVRWEADKKGEASLSVI